MGDSGPIRYFDGGLFAGADEVSGAVPIRPVSADALAEALEGMSAKQREWIGLCGFSAKPGTWLTLAGDENAGREAFRRASILAGRLPGDVSVMGILSRRLPPGDYALTSGGDDPIDFESAIRHWGLGGYRYRSSDEKRPRLTVESDTTEATASVAALNWGRDLINAPGNILRPRVLADEARRLGAKIGADVRIVDGEELAKLCPMTAAVGAAGSPPLLVDMRLSAAGVEDCAKLTIVGKGVTFDSGGLNLKPSRAMRLMKKDMGGAAHALVLGRLIAERKLPVELRLLIPIAENSVSNESYRPGDVLTASNGSTVEVGDTDAEGRLLLADALILAAEGRPDMIIDFATLTGAARVALGADIPNLFVRDEGLDGVWTERLTRAANTEKDPLWPMPLWEPYRSELSSVFADRCSVGKSGLAGSIVAALFLEDFLPKGQPWIHIDTMAWSGASAGAAEAGARIQGVLAVFKAIRVWPAVRDGKRG